MPTAINAPPPSEEPIDPTKNVLDLVNAESKYQDGMREALRELTKFSTSGEAKFVKYMIESESKRLDQLAELRRQYDVRIADMLRTSVESTSNLVSTQLVQIQQTFNDRVAKLEQFRWESGGKTSVSDPALALALEKMAATVVSNKASEIETLAKMAASISTLQTTGFRQEGRVKMLSDGWGWLVGAIGAVVGILAIWSKLT